MINLVWSGRGWLVPAITFGVALIGELAVEGLFRDERYYQTQARPLAAVLAIAGAVVWELGRRWNTGKEQVLVDRATGAEVRLAGDHHRFFFIRMEYWGILLGVLAALRVLGIGG
jgi:hypothetical protein